MNFSLPATLVKKMLAAHSAVGLIVGGFMYLICLTGTLAVFYPQFERWEQPGIDEFHQYDTAIINTAIAEFSTRVEQTPESLYVVFPTRELPRMHISDGENEWYLREDGMLDDEPVEAWTFMLKELHVNLHLPKTLGLIIVSIFGVMLANLIISGVLAHPRIFKDAFRLRIGGNSHQQQADLHNRLSVWGLPFHIMIAITGAFFGLVGILAVIAAPAYYDNDRDALIAEVYGADPVFDREPVNFDFQQAFATLQQQAPDATPIYLVMQKAGTRAQFLEIAATLPGRLIYSEIYRFTAEGEYINHQGLSDGIWGRQTLYSVYHIHFGHFGGLGVQLVYVALGLALTVVSATGINIWLAKRNKGDWISDIWAATVWGTPLALTVAVLVSLITASNPIIAALTTLLISAGYCCYRKDVPLCVRDLRLACGLGLLLVVITYCLLYSNTLNNPTYLGINLALVLTAIVMFWMSLRPLNTFAGQPKATTS